MGDLLRRSDFEELLGFGQARIFEGHPCYCPIQEPHEPHNFEYGFLRNDGEPVLGRYRCNGEPVSFARRAEGNHD